MEIIVPHSIRKRELDGAIDEAEAIFAKIKEKPDLAEAIRAKGLPSRTTLHKVYATSANGARRLLFSAATSNLKSRPDQAAPHPSRFRSGGCSYSTATRAIALRKT